MEALRKAIERCDLKGALTLLQQAEEQDAAWREAAQEKATELEALKAQVRSYLEACDIYYSSDCDCKKGLDCSVAEQIKNKGERLDALRKAVENE